MCWSQRKEVGGVACTPASFTPEKVGYAVRLAARARDLAAGILLGVFAGAA